LVNPLYIQVHARDNVAIIVNPEGLAAGTSFPNGLVLRERIPQSHKNLNRATHHRLAALVKSMSKADFRDELVGRLAWGRFPTCPGTVGAPNWAGREPPSRHETP
jgi:hypothetical protein